MRHWLGAIAAVSGLALAPLASDARIIRIADCGAGAHILVVPSDPSLPSDDSDCAKACHAMTDRRTRSDAKKNNCC